MGVLFLALGYLVGFFFIGLGSYRLFLIWFSQWREIVVSEVFATPGVHSKSQYGIVTYQPMVFYKYEIDGETFMSDKYALSSSEDAGAYDDVKKICDDICANSRVIFVHHRRHDFSVLKLETAKTTISESLAMIVGGVLIIVFLLLVG
jgi:hypothetical protein